MTDGKVQLVDGKVLADSGKVSTADECCCGPSSDCSNCSSDCNNSSQDLVVTMDYVVDAAPHANCTCTSDLSDTNTFSHISTCNWDYNAAPGEIGGNISCVSNVWKMFIINQIGLGVNCQTDGLETVEVTCDNNAPTGGPFVFNLYADGNPSEFCGVVTVSIALAP